MECRIDEFDTFFVTFQKQENPIYGNIKNNIECKTKHKNYCKGCLFNQLIKHPGEYDDYEWTDKDDENYNNITFCEVFFKSSPEYWNLKKEMEQI